ncbi:hypothetical protein GCM10027275_49920 [Rhabdobacter roseus]|uniref:Mobilization protein n=1 Tax=Rhabdobacter roseus TaxID=1655419 RepID=A0A840TVW3_9BACT|nr:DUF5712 family protein [Rhabdobacter roseus]MBB5287055.1 hypothetical protein [Rhabdobacter roseus]
MVIRVLPASKGGIYTNTGTSQALVNYLEHEAREDRDPQRSIFFDQKREGIDSQEVQEHIDANVKGLRKNKPHFHSLVISPSREELRHLEGDEEKLKSYTRQVMDNYAQNFKSRHLVQVEGNDVVWYATVHKNRQYSGLDEEVQTGQVQPKQKKEGEQTHIHVIVSARDKTMSRSLHPDSGSRQFNYNAWLIKSKKDFEQSFGYKPEITEEQQRQRLDKQVNRLERVGLLLDREQMHDIGRSQNYSPDFWKKIKEVESEAKKGDIFTPRQAYERLIEKPELKEQKAKGLNKGDISPPGLVKSKGKFDHSITKNKNGENSKTEIDQTVEKSGEKTGKYNDTSQKFRPLRIDITPLIGALRFDSVPNTGGHATSKEDDFRRRVRRRR